MFTFPVMFRPDPALFSVLQCAVLSCIVYFSLSWFCPCNLWPIMSRAVLSTMYLFTYEVGPVFFSSYFSFLSYPVIACPALSFISFSMLVLSFPVLYCPVLSFPALFCLIRLVLLFYVFPSCPILSGLILSHSASFFPFLFCPVRSCPILSGHIPSYPSYRVLSCSVPSCTILFCPVLSISNSKKNFPLIIVYT